MSDTIFLTFDGGGEGNSFLSLLVVCNGVYVAWSERKWSGGDVLF